jgi:hypothetical protein
MLVEAVFEKEDDPLGVQRYHVRCFSRLTSFVASSFTSFGWRDAGSISISNIPLGKSFS